jgi:hypothetical protein
LAEYIHNETHWSKDAFVKFVDGNWVPLVESQQAEEQEDDGWEDDGWEEEVLEPIDGYTE